MSVEILIPTGIYEQLVDEELSELLESRPDLIASIVGIEDESEPHTYSQFLSQLLHQALPILKSAERLPVRQATAAGGIVAVRITVTIPGTTTLLPFALDDLAWRQ